MRSSRWIGQLVQVISRDTPAYRAARLNRLTIARRHRTQKAGVQENVAARDATTTASQQAAATENAKAEDLRFEATQVDAKEVRTGQRRVVRIVRLMPSSYRGAREIGEHWRDGAFVVMDLSRLDEVDARRLVDFAAGLAFGSRGTIERLANRVFLLSPGDVSLTSADKAQLVHQGLPVPRNEPLHGESDVFAARIPTPRQLPLPADVGELFPN